MELFSRRTMEPSGGTARREQMPAYQIEGVVRLPPADGGVMRKGVLVVVNHQSTRGTAADMCNDRPVPSAYIGREYESRAG